MPAVYTLDLRWLYALPDIRIKRLRKEKEFSKMVLLIAKQTKSLKTRSY